jgi:hypothetical protein
MWIVHKYNITCLLFFTAFILNAQVMLPFKPRYQGKVNGEMTFIGNQILNRIDKENSPNKPYDDLTHENKPNTAFDMEYIDVDDDPKTYSSSAAALFSKNEEKKSVVYAGLYWVGTYKVESAYRKNDRIIGYDDDRFEMEKVKIKFPKKKNYTSIQGSVLFDGIKERNTADQAPYLAYADITEYVKLLDNPFGIYTVANIKATQGTLEGGSFGGWMIFFVLEDPEMPEKTIYSFDGFANVFQNSYDVTLTDLKEIGYPITKTEMIVAALGGDNRNGGDMVYLSSNTSPTLTNLRTRTRSTGNLFNSTLHHFDQPYMSRIPASKNTLGFDIFQTKLELGKDFITPETNQLQFRLKTSNDRYFFYFTAISTENIEEEEPVSVSGFAFGKIKKELEARAQGAVYDGTNIVPFEMRGNESALKSVDEFEQNPVHSKVMETTPENLEIQKEKEKVPFSINATVKANALEKTKPIENTTSNSPQQKQTVDSKEKLDIRILNHPELKKGYYLVANVFSESVNARQFLSNLKKQGVLADYFVNPVNQYHYVYLSYATSLETAAGLKLSKLNNTYNGEIWLLAVNISENP